MKPKPKIVIATIGTTGDMLPFVTIAHALTRRGHTVQMLVPKFYETLVRSLGIEPLVFGTIAEYESGLADPDLWTADKGATVAWRRWAVPNLGTLKELMAQQPTDTPCVLLCHPFLVSIADIAKAARTDLRIVCAYMAPSNLCSSHDFPVLGPLRIPSWTPLSCRKLLWRIVSRHLVDPVFLPQLNVVRIEHRLRTVADYLDHVKGVPDAAVGLFPPWFGARQPDWPKNVLESDFPFTPPGGTALLSPELRQFLSKGNAPVAFTPGTGHQHAEKYFQVALQALMRLGRRGLLITPHAEQVPANLPPEVMWIDRAPFDILLPRVAALVHHGGIGTTAQAFRSGIPQLIVPYAFDQFDNGFRASKLGVADVVLPRQLTASRMRRQLARLLSSKDVQLSCSQLRQRATDDSIEARLMGQIEAAFDVALA